MAIDLLDLAGDASAILERHGLVACGRRINGTTRIDFWTRDGRARQYELRGDEVTVAEIVEACLAHLPVPTMPRPPQGRSDLN